MPRRALLLWVVLSFALAGCASDSATSVDLGDLGGVDLGGGTAGGDVPVVDAVGDGDALPDAVSDTPVGPPAGPCILLSPAKIGFGGRLVKNVHSIQVDVTSCGEGLSADLVISEIALDAQSAGTFTLDLGGMPLTAGGVVDAGVGAIAEGDSPIVLPANATASFTVTYQPVVLLALDGAGKPILDLGRVQLKSNAFVPHLAVDVSGYGASVQCPTAFITVHEGEEVIPQTKLHLSGSQSFPTNGIKRYEWEAQQPVGSQSVFLPSFLAPDPTFEVNVAGEYVFRLKVFDTNDEESCDVADYHVMVVPDVAIHVELLWSTKGDADESDEGPEAGADLDLHFLHPFATGKDVDGDGKLEGWFDPTFDCFWFNAHPNWGSLNPTAGDNPGLDRDDTDGAGPENLNLNIPEEGLTYRIGVHYWTDHLFGPSEATVRIYFYDSLPYEVGPVKLVNRDFWEVATVDWPTADITPITQPGGGYRIFPNYKSPFFASP